MRQEPEFAAQPAQPRRTAFAEQHEPAEQRPVAQETFKVQAAPGARYGRHAVAPGASEKRPAAQGAQKVAAVTPEAVPSGHAVQTTAEEAPVVALYVPGGQGTGSALPGQKWPAGQGRAPPVSQEKPAGHAGAIGAAEEALPEEGAVPEALPVGEDAKDAVARGLAVRPKSETDERPLFVAEEENGGDEVCVGVFVKVAEPEGVFVKVADPEGEDVPPLCKDAVDCRDGEKVAQPEVVRDSAGDLENEPLPDSERDTMPLPELVRDTASERDTSALPELERDATADLEYEAPPESVAEDFGEPEALTEPVAVAHSDTVADPERVSMLVADEIADDDVVCL